MKKIVLFIIVHCSLLIVHCFGQGTLRGKITDENGESLIGVTIVLKENRSVGTITDFDGNYSLKINEKSPQTIVISYVSYQTIEEQIIFSDKEILIKNFILKSITSELNEVEIVGKAEKSKEYYMEQVKSKSATSIDYISSEIIKKTGDANVTAAITRVPGVSTNGAFITVRGIGDRYIKTTINGLRIPTLDPFTNNIKLDMFPSSLVDNIIITKTSSPDLPNDWGGAYISIETKDYPEMLMINAETSFGYNSHTSFKDVLSTQRSTTDWMGFDNGFRDYNHDEFVAANVNPGQYEEFVALGLGDYYNSIGVIGTTPWNDTYFKLGLVELGLLEKAQFDDADAFAEAKQKYEEGPYRSQAFNIINSGAVKTGKAFPNNWNTKKKPTLLNFSQSFGIGNQITLFNKPFGFIAGFRYGSSMMYDEESTSNRLRFDRSYESVSEQEISKEINSWSALINMAYKINSNNSVTLMIMPNFSGVNNVLNSSNKADSTQFVMTKNQFYEEREQMVYQFKSEHYIPSSKVKVDINASYTDGNSSAPDFKNLQYWKDAKSNAYQIGFTIGEGIRRYYRYLSEDIFDSKITFEIPLSENPGLLRKLKAGGGYQKNNRSSDQYDYVLNFGSLTYPLLNEDLDSYFSIDKFDINNYTDKNGNHNTIDYYYERIDYPVNHTFGYSAISNGFLMLDYAITKKLRFTGGFRAEQAKIFTDVRKYHSLEYQKDDSRRYYAFGLPMANPGEIENIDILPSGNLIYRINDSEANPINLRANFSQTVARPGIRELSDISNYDYELRSSVYVNSDLKPVRILNYDIRLETYFKSGDNLSISMFYKDFKNHIELINSSGFTWQNVEKAYARGIEIEFKKIITRQLDIRANVALIQSASEFIHSRLQVKEGIKEYIPLDTIKRNMFGQSPYVVNAMITYIPERIGMTISASYNVQGPRLTIASQVNEIPDIYELPRNMIDIKATKIINKHFSLSLAVRDLLNSSINRSYKYPEKWIVYDKYTYGTNYIFSILYKL